MDIKSLPLYSPMAGIPDSKAQGAENAVRALSNPAQGKSDPAEVQKAAKEFEGYFIAYLLKEMRNTVHPGLVKNKDGQQFYSFYDQEIGRLAAQNGGIGLSRMLEQSLARGPHPSDEAPKSGPTQVSPPFSR
jgi:Rod binding domain-containing protein